jgi:hypothetical protein
MSSQGPRQPPRQVPTLTEVVHAEEQGDTRAAPEGDGGPSDVDATRGNETQEGAAPVPAGEPERGEDLAERVLADVQRQIDLVLEQRLREMLAPALARLSEALMQDSREQLAVVLRDVVAQAVARELERQRRR